MTQKELNFDAAERWRPVVNFEARYDVSDQGRVWSRLTNRILRASPTSRGYLSVVLYRDAKPKAGRSFCVHDLVAAAFIGPKPEGYQVDHGQLGKRCNAVGNLEYVTREENMRRAVKFGLVIPPKNIHGLNQYRKKVTA